MKDVILCLYDITGNMAKPWLEAGYTAVIVDKQHKAGTHQDGNIIKVGADIRNGWIPPREMVERIAFVAAFPPCDHLAARLFDHLNPEHAGYFEFRQRRVAA